MSTYAKSRWMGWVGVSVYTTSTVALNGPGLKEAKLDDDDDDEAANHPQPSQLVSKAHGRTKGRWHERFRSSDYRKLVGGGGEGG